MRLILLTTACLVLAACATGPHPAKVVAQPVNMVVPVSCVPASVGPAPNYSLSMESWAKAPGATPAARNSDRMNQLWVAVLEREKRLAVLEPVVAGCR